MVELYDLIFHLKSCPASFFQPPLKATGGIVDTNALIADVYRKIYGDIQVKDSLLPEYDTYAKFHNDLGICVHIGCWFYSHPSFANKRQLLPGVKQFLFTELPLVCKYVQSRQWIEEDDRVEEFIRLALKCCNVKLNNETEEDAADRFDSVSTIKRQKVLEETNAAMKRMQEIQRKMAEQKAREAANTYGRE